MKILDPIEGAIKEEISRLFPRIEIYKVDVEHGLSGDGDDVLRINIIFEGKQADLEPKVLAAVIRNLRPRLAAVKESAFPLVSFISKAELPRNRRASA